MAVDVNDLAEATKQRVDFGGECCVIRPSAGFNPVLDFGESEQAIIDRAERFQRGAGFAVGLCGDGAARVEMAPRLRIKRVGDFAFDRHEAAAALVQTEYLGQQHFGVGRGGGRRRFPPSLRSPAGAV